MNLSVIRRPLLTLGFFTALSACGGSAPESIFDIASVQSGPLVVTVNGTEIHQGLLDTLATMNPRLKAQIDNPLTRRKILNSLVEHQLLFQEAVNQNVYNDEQVRLKTLFNKHNIIANGLIEKELEASMKKAYEERKDSQFTRVDVSQIVVNSLSEEARRKGDKPTDAQKEAAKTKIEALKKRLAAGEDFAKLAKEASDDKRTAVRGGESGQVARDDKRLERTGLKGVAEAAFKLKKGEVSEPIETPTGYVLVKVTSDPTITSFEDAKRVLGFELQASLRTKLVDALKKKAVITFADTKPVAGSGLKVTDTKIETKPASPAPAPTPTTPKTN